MAQTLPEARSHPILTTCSTSYTRSLCQCANYASQQNKTLSRTKRTISKNIHDANTACDRYSNKSKSICLHACHGSRFTRRSTNRWKVQTHAILEYADVGSPLDIVPCMNCSYSISIKIQDNSEREMVSTEHSAYDYTMAPNIQLV